MSVTATSLDLTAFSASLSCFLLASVFFRAVFCEQYTLNFCVSYVSFILPILASLYGIFCVCLFFSLLPVFQRKTLIFFILSCRKLDFRSKTFKTFPVASTLRIFPLLGLSCRSHFQFSLWFGALFHPAVSAHPSCNTFPSHYHWSK